MKYFLFPITAIFILVGAGCNQNREVVKMSPENNVSVQNAVDANSESDVPSVGSDTPGDVVINAVPGAVKHTIKVIKIPFTSQAPFANWDMPYQEACEEASMIMLEDFVNEKVVNRIEPVEADKRILDLVNWEIDNGYPIDLTAAQVVEVFSKKFGIKAHTALYNAALIREEINDGRAVILPAAGRLLGNPNFRQPGPLYHMLVVKGYEGDDFITNDPGTRNGENFRYHYSAFDRAVHDWNGGDVVNGNQVMILLDELQNP